MMRELIIRAKEMWIIVKKNENSTLIAMLTGVGFFFIIATIPVLIITTDKLRGWLGLLAGSVMSVAMIFHMNYVLGRSMYMEKNQSGYLAGNSIGRLLVVGAILAVTVRTGWANYWTMFVGLLGLKVSAYTEPIITRMYNKINEKKVIR